jgi:plastocyanin
MRRLLLVIGIVSGGFFLVPMVASAANASAHIVTCTGFAGCFSPNPIRISAGSTVMWTNDTSLTHTATADNGAWDTGNVGSGQSSVAITFNSPGTFAYHCSIHPTMQGTVVVTTAATATVAPSARTAATPASRGLAQAGLGPTPLFGAALLLIGLGLFATSGLRRKAKV